MACVLVDAFDDAHALVPPQFEFRLFARRATVRGGQDQPMIVGLVVEVEVGFGFDAVVYFKGVRDLVLQAAAQKRSARLCTVFLHPLVAVAAPAVRLFRLARDVVVPRFSDAGPSLAEDHVLWTRCKGGGRLTFGRFVFARALMHRLVRHALLQYSLDVFAGVRLCERDGLAGDVFVQRFKQPQGLAGQQLCVVVARRHTFGRADGVLHAGPLRRIAVLQIRLYDGRDRAPSAG